MDEWRGESKRTPQRKWIAHGAVAVQMRVRRSMCVTCGRVISTLGSRVLGWARGEGGALPWQRVPAGARVVKGAEVVQPWHYMALKWVQHVR